MRSICTTFLTIASVITHSVAAQPQTEVTPYIGSYRPSNILGLGRDTAYLSGVGNTVKHLSGVTWGVRVTKWWPGHLGMEASLGYAPSALWSSYLPTAWL